MAKISKPAIISLSILGFLILATIIMLIPIGGRTFLAKAFDGTGNHKAALGTDLFFQGKAGGLLQNLSVNDLSKADQCQNTYKILKNEKLNFLLPISGQNKITVKPTSNDKILWETKFGGAINPTSRKASANLEMMIKIDQNSAKDLVSELAGAGLNLGTFVPSEFKTQISGFFDLNSILFTVNKFDLKTSDINSSNGLSNYYQFDHKNKDAGIEKTRQEGWEEVFGELKNLANIKLDEVVEETTFNQIAQTTCKTVESMKVEAPTEIDFEGTKKFVRPITTTYKQNILETQLDDQEKIIQTLQKDAKFQKFVLGKYQTYLNLGNGFNKIIPPTATQKEAFKPISEQEFKDQITKGFATDKTEESKIIRQAKIAEDKESLKQMEEYYKFALAPSVTYIDANSGDIYGNQTGISVVFTDKMKQNFSPKIKDLLGDSVYLMSQSWNIQYGDKVKDLDLPTNTKPAADFAKDLGNTDAAKKIQSETQKNTQTPSYENGEIDFTNPYQTNNSDQTNNNNLQMKTPNSTFGNSIPNSTFNSRGSFGNSFGNSVSSSPTSVNSGMMNPNLNSSVANISTNSNLSDNSNQMTPFGGTNSISNDPMAGTNDALNMGN